MHDRSPKRDDHPPNDHYEDDICYTFQFLQWILKPIGIYPLVYAGTSAVERIASAFLLLTCFCILQFVILPFSCHVLFYEKDMNARIKFFGPLLFCLVALGKYAYLALKGPTLGQCIEHVERDWWILRDPEHRDIMLKHVTMSRNLITLCAAFMYTGGLSYHTIMPLLSKQKIDENVTIRPLTYPGYEAFFDVQESPTYEIVYLMHCVYVLVSGNISMTAYSLAAIFTSHACGQIEIQSSRLENLIGEKKGGQKSVQDVEDRFAIVVRDHVEILRFTKNVEEALSDICLMEVVVSTLLICFLEYYCLMEWETSDSIAILTYFVLLTSFTFNILIFCYVGELLLGQGNKIASASYETEWYNLPGRKARDIVLLLAISKYPPKLTAGKILVLSLNTFGVVLKSSIVYLNMLRTITEL